MAKNVEHDFSPGFDLAKEINDEAGIKPTEYAPYRFPVEFQIKMFIICTEKGDLDKALHNDPVLLQEIRDVVSAEDGPVAAKRKALIKAFGGALEDINTIAKKGQLQEAKELFENAFSEKTFKLHADPICELMVAGAEKRWKAIVKAKAGYSRYQFQTAAKFVILTGGIVVTVGVNVAVIASSGFHFGAGIALSAYGLARTSAALLKLTIQCFQGVDSAIEDTLRVLARVEKKKKRSDWISTPELLAETIFNAIGNELSGLGEFFDTVKKAQHKAELARNKLYGTKVALHRLSEKLNALMKEQDAIATKLAILQAAGALDSIPKKYRFNPAKMVETQKKVTKLFKQVKVAYKAYEERDAKLADAEQALEALAKLKSSKVIGVVHTGTVVAMKALLLAASVATMDFSSVADAVSVGFDLGCTAVDAGNDVALAAMEKLEISHVLSTSEFKAFAQTS